MIGRIAYHWLQMLPNTTRALPVEVGEARRSWSVP